MGQSTSKQRAAHSAKTGVFALHNEFLLTFPDRCLQLPTLRTLHIEECRLSSLPAQLTKFGPTLKKLILCGNSLKEFELDLRQFVALETIDLSRNQIRKLPEHGWGGVAKLSKLLLG